jgi:hypothetical protein
VRLRPPFPTLLLAVLLLAAPGMPASARAQTPPQWKATVVASVLVAPPPILLTTTRDLYFGNVSQGQVVSVPAQAPYPVGTWSAAARIGNLAKTVRYGVTLTLPAQLVNGTASMAVSWNGTQYGWLCVWNQTVGTPGVCAVAQGNFNPSQYTSTPMVVDLPNNTPQNHVFAFDIYLGAQLTVPTGALKPGTYSAPVRVTVAILN